MERLYFENSENGLLKENCHPLFTANFIDEFYYDVTDEFSPFGNDDGADTLFRLEEWYKEKKTEGNIVKWMYKFIDEAGYIYGSESASQITDFKTMLEIEDEDPNFFIFLDKVIIATAFGQIKIAGKIDAKLKKNAISALDRELLLFSNTSDIVFEHNLKINTMKKDLFGFVVK